VYNDFFYHWKLVLGVRRLKVIARSHFSQVFLWYVPLHSSEDYHVFRTHAAGLFIYTLMAAALVATRRRGTAVQSRPAIADDSDGRVFPAQASIIEDLELRVLLGRHETNCVDFFLESS
jgi:hypothetical protein